MRNGILAALVATLAVTGCSGKAGSTGAQGPQGVQGAAGATGPRGPAGGPLLKVVDGNGDPVGVDGVAYFFDGTFVGTREAHTGGTTFVFRRIDNGTAADPETLYFEAADCSSAPLLPTARPIAVRNHASLYTRAAKTPVAATIQAALAADAACAASTFAGPVYPSVVLGSAAALPAPLDVVP